MIPVFTVRKEEQEHLLGLIARFEALPECEAAGGFVIRLNNFEGIKREELVQKAKAQRRWTEQKFAGMNGLIVNVFITLSR